MFLTAIQDITAVYQRGNLFSTCQIFSFSSMSKPVHTRCIQTIYSHILQIDCKKENARSLHECVQAQRERKKGLKSLSSLNDVHTETMGRRSD